MNQLGAMITGWIDRRIDRFAATFADCILRQSGCDQVGDLFASFLLGLNDELKNT